jgi:hypothetical protein
MSDDFKGWVILEMPFETHSDEFRAKMAAMSTIYFYDFGRAERKDGVWIIADEGGAGEARRFVETEASKCVLDVQSAKKPKIVQ